MSGPLSGSEEPLPLKWTVSGAEPLVGSRLMTAVGGWLPPVERDPPDRAALEVGVEEVAVRPDHEVHGMGGRRR